MSYLVIKAGEIARKHLLENGLSASDVFAVSAAGGGPKWFSCYGLTRYVLNDLLSESTHEIHYLGSSVGSWQMACGLSSNPAKMLGELKNLYAGWEYSSKPSKEEVSMACRAIANQTLETEIEGIINHPNKKLHVFTSRMDKKKNTKIGELFQFGNIAVRNLVGRKFINGLVQRTVFSTARVLPFHSDRDPLTSVLNDLTSENYSDVFQASAAIPFVMNPVVDIRGGQKGYYWDGAITDYHITLPYLDSKGLIVVPHFGSQLIPGWFDKKLPWKREVPDNFLSRVVLLCPSEKFVQSLPNKRISEMKDFYRFKKDVRARKAYWLCIADASERMAEEFHRMRMDDSIGHRVLSL